VKVSSDSFNKVGEVQQSAVSGSHAEELVTQQPALDYFPDKHLFEEFANTV
jgi:hypothetical protein